MWTEAGRRSQEAVASVQKPAPGWPERDELTANGNPLPPPRRALVAIGTNHALGIVSFLIPAAIAVTWSASIEAPSTSDLLFVVGGGLYVAVLTLQTTRFAKKSRRAPEPWPEHLAARTPMQMALGWIVLTVIACVFIAFTFPGHTAKEIRINWLSSGAFVGGVLGAAFELRRTRRAERRLGGVRLYREPPPWLNGADARRAARLVYAGPPPSAEE